VFEFCETPKVRSAEHQRLVLSQLMLGNQPTFTLAKFVSIGVLII
jgi:hypothetical protein